MNSFTRIATATALSLASTGAVLAADLPARVAPAPYVAPLPVFTWTGAYFGLNAGAAFDNKQEFRSNGATVLASNRRTVNGDGFSAGGQVGYNYQLGGFGGYGGGIVVGLEADAMYMDTDKSINVPTGTGNTRFTSGLDFLGTVRGRVGYAFNQLLVYGTGGFAYGDVNSQITRTGNNNSGSSIARASGITGGYTYGGGIEYALPTASFLNFFKSSAVTVKAEYLRYELDSRNLDNTSGVTLTTAGRTRVTNDGNLARIGLNYKF